MTKEEISKYIFDNEIPVKFIWEDYTVYKFIIYIDNTVTHNFKGVPISQFPNWGVVDTTFSYYIKFVTEGFTELYKSENENIEQCIGDFLFWFEINKSRCKSITYYD